MFNFGLDLWLESELSLGLGLRERFQYSANVKNCSVVSFSLSFVVQVDVE